MPAATVAAALQAMLDFYAIPGTWTTGNGTPGDVETALHEAVGDPDEPGIPEAEWDHRSQMICAVFDACGCDLAALGDVVSHQRAVVAVLTAGLAAQGVAILTDCNMLSGETGGTSICSEGRFPK